MIGWVVWIGICVGGLVVAAATVEAYLKRNRTRRLSDMRPDPNALKHRPWEADGVTNVNVIDEVHAMNQGTEPRNWWRSRRSK
ncbi:hypothetical protein [Ruegeria arenilitoris]|uniref:hypothetical protein n=1 Tax=Ruegeria arenilitoris TaxID=1173585 RepID=UPI0014809D20|nr:hypothetical protein [Ruegeria arenilitoris]